MSYLAANAVSALLVSFLAASAAGAQTSVDAANTAVARLFDGSRLVRVHRAASRIVIDGRLDDAAWSAAEVASGFVQQRPDPGAAASQRSEARVLFDAEALYVSMRLYDDRPDSLLAPLGRRDYEGYGDWAHVIVDSYHDRRTGFHFAVNPAGTRRDAMITNDAEWQEDASWDAVWDVATARDSLGWTAEFRIPLTQLRFDRCGVVRPGPATLSRPGESLAAAGSCAWGIQFMRDLARRNERSIWAPIPADAGGYVSRFGTLAGVEGIRAPRRFEVVPYSLAQVTRPPLDRSDPFYQRTKMGGALGADIGLGITSKLTLMGTINPDFGQVEADPSEVNLTSAETFLRERRPFFVEGGDIFRYSLGDGLIGEDQLFYSRRIGRAPQIGDPDGAVAVHRPPSTSILGAAKVSGKAGPWTLGMLDAVTGAERGQFVTQDGARASFLAEPRTNYTFGRLYRDGSDGRNSVGLVGSAMSRDLDAESARWLRSDAVAGGVDARVRSRARAYTFAANLLGSYVRGTPEAITETQRSSVHLLQRPDRGGDPLDTTRTRLSGASAELRASKQGGGHWRWGVNGRAVTSGFETNDVGFQLRSDVATTAGWVGYAHFEPGPLVRRWELWANYWGRWTFNGDRELFATNIFGVANFQNNWTAMGELRRQYSQMSPTLLRGGPATYVPPNVVWWNRVMSDPRRLVSAELITQGAIDDAGGGYRLSLSPIVTVRPSSRAELSLQPNVTRVHNPAQYVTTSSAGGDTSYVTGALEQTTSAVTARVNVAFTPALSLQLYAQPFFSVGRYRSLGEVRSSRAHRLPERIPPFDPAAVSSMPHNELRIDRGQGREPITLDDPDFAVRELESNVVLRWEYRPGSALFLVWSQARNDDDRATDYSMARQARDLWRTPSTNVLLIKASYWIAP